MTSPVPPPTPPASTAPDAIRASAEAASAALAELTNEAGKWKLEAQEFEASLQSNLEKITKTTKAEIEFSRDITDALKARTEQNRVMQQEAAKLESEILTKIGKRIEAEQKLKELTEKKSDVTARLNHLQRQFADAIAGTGLEDYAEKIKTLATEEETHRKALEGYHKELLDKTITEERRLELLGKIRGEEEKYGAAIIASATAKNEFNEAATAIRLPELAERQKRINDLTAESLSLGKQEVELKYEQEEITTETNIALTEYRDRLKDINERDIQAEAAKGFQKYFENITSKLGMTSKSTDTFLGKLAVGITDSKRLLEEYTTTLQLAFRPEALAATGFNLLEKGMVSIASKTYETVIAVDKEAAAFNKAFGRREMFVDAANDLAVVARQNGNLGITLGELTKNYSALYGSYKQFSQLNREQQVELTKTATQFELLGVSVQKQGELLTKLGGFTDFSQEKFKSLTENLVRSAHKIGESVDTVVTNFSTNVDTFAVYGSKMEETFLRVQAVSTRTGVAFSNLLAVTNRFDEFSTGAQAVGQLNAALGGDYLNAIDMLNSKEDERILKIKSAMDATGVSFTVLGKYQQKLIATAAGFSSVSDAANFFKKNTAELSIEMANNKDQSEKMAEAAANSAAVMDKLKTIMGNLTIAIGPFVKGISIIVDGLMSLNKSSGGFLFPIIAGITGVLFLIRSVYSAGLNIKTIFTGADGIAGGLKQILLGQKPITANMNEQITILNSQIAKEQEINKVLRERQQIMQTNRSIVGTQGTIVAPVDGQRGGLVTPGTFPPPAPTGTPTVIPPVTPAKPAAKAAFGAAAVGTIIFSVISAIMSGGGIKEIGLAIVKSLLGILVAGILTAALTPILGPAAPFLAPVIFTFISMGVSKLMDTMIGAGTVGPSGAIDMTSEASKGKIIIDPKTGQRVMTDPRDNIIAGTPEELSRMQISGSPSLSSGFGVGISSILMNLAESITMLPEKIAQVFLPSQADQKAEIKKTEINNIKAVQRIENAEREKIERSRIDSQESLRIEQIREKERMSISERQRKQGASPQEFIITGGTIDVNIEGTLHKAFIKNMRAIATGEPISIPTK